MSQRSFKKMQQDAHVYSKVNEEYYKTSKVITPFDEDYLKGSRKYPEQVKEAFRKLKRELTYESQKHKTEVDYNKFEVNYGLENCQYFSIIFEEDLKNTGMQSIDISENMLRKIKKCLPSGFRLNGISTHIYNSDIYENDRFLGMVDNTPTIQITVSFDKTTKKRGIRN